MYELCALPKPGPQHCMAVLGWRIICTFGYTTFSIPTTVYNETAPRPTLSFSVLYIHGLRE